MIMAARVKAGWIEAPSRRSRPRPSDARRVRSRSGPERSWQGRGHVGESVDAARSRSGPASSPARSQPPAELIRFVVGPDGGSCADLQPQAAGPRRLGHRPPRPRSARRSSAALFAPRLQDQGRRSARQLAADIDGVAAARISGRALPSPTRRGWSSPASPRSRRRSRERPRRCPDPCRGGGRGWATKAGKPVAQTPRRSHIWPSGHPRFVEDELDLALGRAHVIHAALVAGAASDGFLARWRRLPLLIRRRGRQPDRTWPARDARPANRHDYETRRI